MFLFDERAGPVWGELCVDSHRATFPTIRFSKRFETDEPCAFGVTKNHCYIRPSATRKLASRDHALIRPPDVPKRERKRRVEKIPRWPRGAAANNTDKGKVRRPREEKTSWNA